MTDRLIRLMRLITLIQDKPGILARELAERCEATERLYLKHTWSIERRQRLSSRSHTVRS